MFITCSFKSDGTGRAYTYSCDIEDDVSAGDKVVVAGPDGAEKIVTVLAVDLPEPSFACKPVLRLHVDGDDGNLAVATAVNERAVIGGNNPPDPIDDICRAFEDSRIEAEGWLDGALVENEGQMTHVDALRSDMRTLRLKLEGGQKSATAPLYDAYKAELARWKPTIEDVKTIEAGLVAISDTFKRQLAEKKEAEKRAAWAAADAARREAEAAASAANAANIEAQREAAQKAAVAQEALAAASAKQKDTVKGMRTVTRYEVTDHSALLHWIARNHRDDVTAFIDEWARRNHKADRNADGLRVWDEKEAF